MIEETVGYEADMEISGSLCRLLLQIRHNVKGNGYSDTFRGETERDLLMRNWDLLLRIDY